MAAGQEVDVARPQLFLTLDASAEVPLNRQVYEQIRGAILRGSLRPGDKLPSSRQLATELGVSRTVVVNAYDLLFADGFVNGQQGSATRVADTVTAISEAMPEAAPAPSFASAYSGAAAPAPRGRPIRFDLRPSVPSWSSFPTKRWSRAVHNAILRAGQEDVGYGPAEGVAEFRAAIAAHVRLRRGIGCDAADLVVTSGATQALDLLARTVISSGDVVVVEDPTHPVLRRVFENNKARVVPVPVDDSGLVVGAIPQALAAAGETSDRVVLAYVTPTHQFPTGAVMSLERRLELIRWARANRVVIIEDDYDSDFAYGTLLPSALAGLDRSVVAYIGTFSKSMFPAVRLGYAVLPDELAARFIEQKWLADRLTSAIDQLAMAEFLTSGSFDEHVERMNELYGVRYRALAHALTARFGRRVTISGAPAGLHVMAQLDVTRPAEQISTRAAQLGVRMYPCEDFFLDREPEGAPFLFGHGALSPSEIAASIDIVHAAAE